MSASVLSSYQSSVCVCLTQFQQRHCQSNDENPPKKKKQKEVAKLE